MKNQQSNLYLPIILFILVLTVAELIVIIFFSEHILAFVISTILVNLLLGIFWVLQARKFRIKQDNLIHKINSDSDESLNSLLAAIPVGVVRFNPTTFEPEWYNAYVEVIFSGSEEGLSSTIVESLVQANREDGNHLFKYNERHYAVMADYTKSILYLLDATSEQMSRVTLAQSRPVIGVVSVDNYDDATDSTTESERSTINSFIITFLDNFAHENLIYLRRLQSDRFVFFTNHKVLSKLIGEKFKVLSDFESSASARNLSIALSMGISYGADDFAVIGKTAISNLDLALVRGGAQVVVKEGTDSARAAYFGGNSESRVERSRTRARAVASAMRNIISEVDRVFVVGHRYPDLDALGAGIAMKNFAQAIGKEAYVVYDPEQLLPDVSRAVAKLNAHGGLLYEQIIHVDTAKRLKTANSLLIMVDHSKISQTLDMAFYNTFAKVVVIDHHRRDEEFPPNALFNYIETGASSASEMAVELLQFQTNRAQEMTSVEASVILAGISVDTSSFSKGTTARTFEAASYLREHDADNDLIRYFLAMDFLEYKSINALVLSAEVSEPYAIACGSDEIRYENIVAAKAADQLLSIKGVKASFTITRNKAGDVAISARSVAPINVQILMEAMGGGGHFDSAATQIKDTTIEEVRTRLIQTIGERINR